MPSRVAVLAVDALDVEAVAGFWCQVLGHEVVDRDDEIVSIAGRHGPAIDVLSVTEGNEFWLLSTADDDAQV